jgi:hypothetical protein
MLMVVPTNLSPNQTDARRLMTVNESSQSTAVAMQKACQYNDRRDCRMSLILYHLFTALLLHRLRVVQLRTALARCAALRTILAQDIVKCFRPSCLARQVFMAY